MKTLLTIKTIIFFLIIAIMLSGCYSNREIKKVKVVDQDTIMGLAWIQWEEQQGNTYILYEGVVDFNHIKDYDSYTDIAFVTFNTTRPNNHVRQIRQVGVHLEPQVVSYRR